MVSMIFTYNIGVGMTAGFIAYPLMKASTGRLEEVKRGLWVLTLLRVRRERVTAICPLRGGGARRLDFGRCR